MKYAVKQVGIFLLETFGIAIKSAVAAGIGATVVIIICRHFHVIWI